MPYVRPKNWVTPYLNSWKNHQFEDEDYYMSPKRARNILEHLIRTYLLTLEDIHYMTWINLQSLDKIMNHPEELYGLTKQTTDRIVHLYKTLWAKDLKFYRKTNDGLDKLVYYMKHWHKMYRQTEMKAVMRSKRRSWNQRTGDIFDVLDIEKCIKEKDVYYNKDFLDRLIKTNDNYFFFGLDMWKTRTSKHYPKWMTTKEIKKWTKVFLTTFSKFPSDLYDKYLRFSFRNRPDTEPATWGQKEAIDKIQETWFIFCF